MGPVKPAPSEKSIFRRPLFVEYGGDASFFRGISRGLLCVGCGGGGTFARSRQVRWRP